jgi:hypothetical protein
MVGSKTGAERKSPGLLPGLECLHAVITVGHLLREGKQGMTASQLSFNP